MPLTVYNEVDHHHAAMLLYSEASGVLANRRVDVGMFHFAAAMNPQEKVFLGTSGAGPCTIILVHATNGIGALGHYGGDPNPNHIVAGVTQMVATLGSPPIDTILFSAGNIRESGPLMAQKAFEMMIVASCVRAYPGAVVSWPVQPGKGSFGTFGACIYYPQGNAAALYDSYPGLWAASASPQFGFRTGHFFSAYKDGLTTT